MDNEEQQFWRTAINHPKEVRLLIIRYKPKAQCRGTQASENCVPQGRDIYAEFIEPTHIANIQKPISQTTLFWWGIKPHHENTCKDTHISTPQNANQHHPVPAHQYILIYGFEKNITTGKSL